MLPWRSKTCKRLDIVEREMRRFITGLSWVNGRMDRMDDALKAKWDAMKDVVKAAESAMDSLKMAADWLRSHHGDDVSGLAEDMDKVAQELADKVKSVAASGGVSE